MLGQLSAEEMENMLQKNFIGRIGCNDGEKTYVVPVSYRYKNNTLLCHSRDGMKIEMMRRNPEVCFEVDEIKDYTHWRCIIAWGTYDEITEEKEIEQAQQYFVDYLLSLKTSETALPPDTQQDRYHSGKPEYSPAIYYRIHLKKITGRFEHSL